MKRWLPVLLLLLCSAPSWATWAVVQHVITSTCTTTVATCPITVSSTGTGHVIAIGMMVSIAGETLSSVSGGGTYIHPAGCAGSDSAGARASDCAYTLASTSGTTTITVTRASTTSATWRCDAIELSFNGTSVSLDLVGNRDQTTAVTSAPGVSLSLTGSNDTVIQYISGVSPVSISAPYGADFVDTATNSAAANAHNITGSTFPSWGTSSGRASLSAIAFAEVGGAPIGISKIRKLARLGVY